VLLIGVGVLAFDVKIGDNEGFLVGTSNQLKIFRYLLKFRISCADFKSDCSDEIDQGRE
jgi:hypothetical protein